MCDAIRGLYLPRRCAVRRRSARRSGVGLAACSGDSRPSWRCCPARRRDRSPHNRRPPPQRPQPPPRSRDAASPARGRRATPATRSPRGSIPRAARSPATRCSPGATPRASAATTLRFHLYYNAWRNTRSTWMRERRLGGDAGAVERPEADWGWIDVTQRCALIRGGASAPADLTRRSRASSRRTTATRTTGRCWRCRSTAPVAPGETINVQIAWTSRVPRTFARTGAIGDYYFLAQWFPKIGVLEDTGWNCHQFHAATEFFADFGTYDVRLTVPHGWIVGATGRRARAPRRTRDGTTTHHYYQEDVHDFAWTTSPDYLERRAQVRAPDAAGGRHAPAAAAGARGSGRPALRGDARGAEVLRRVVRPLSVRAHHHRRSAWQSGAGGMEYPTLFTAGTRWLAPRGVDQPEGVTVHEAGHQFWYGIVANNEFEHAWMDEGSTPSPPRARSSRRFEPNYYAKRYFGGFVPWVSATSRSAARRDGNRLAGYRPAARGDTPVDADVALLAGDGERDHATTRPRCGCTRSSGMLGWDTLQRILSTYFAAGRSGIRSRRTSSPSSNEVSGRDLTWFFDQVHRSSNVFDYGVDTFRASRSPHAGFVGDGDAAAFSASRRRQRAVPDHRRRAPVRRGRVSRRRAGRLRERRRGPLAVGRPRSLEAVRDRQAGARRRSSQVDPDRVLLLDVNYTNNSATLDAAGAARGAQMVARVAGLAAGSSADLRVLRLMTALAAFRDGIRRVNGAPMVLAGMFAVTLLRRAAAVARAARHDRGAPRAEPRGGAGGGRHELRLVAGVLRAGVRARHDVRAVDHRLRRGARQPERAARQRCRSPRRSPGRPPPGWCCGRS